MYFRAICALLLAFLQLSVGHSSAMAQIPSPTAILIPELLGRWDVSFRSPQVDVDTVWVIEATASSSTSIGTLGKNSSGLTVSNVDIAGDVVTLAGTSRAGPLAVTGKLSEGRLEGHFTAGPIAGTFLAVRRADGRSRDLITIFDQATQTFAASLFTPAPFDKAWQAKRDELRAQMEAPGATERDMVRAVRTLLSATRLSHNDFYIPASVEVDEQATQAGSAVTWRRLNAGIGYIRINQFVADPSERGRLDQAFAELKDTTGLIVDLMDNPGGDLGLAARLGDHLLSAGASGGLFATRMGMDAAGVTTMERIPAAAFEPFNGYDTNDFQEALSRTGAVKLITGGRAPLYSGAVALLINRNSGSSSEAVAAMMKETGRARLFGTRSAGQMLSSRKIPLGDGYVLRVAYADFRTPKGEIAEKVGIEPDQTVEGSVADVEEAAIIWLSGQR